MLWSVGMVKIRSSYMGQVWYYIWTGFFSCIWTRSRIIKLLNGIRSAKIAGAKIAKYFVQTFQTKWNDSEYLSQNISAFFLNFFRLWSQVSKPWLLSIITYGPSWRLKTVLAQAWPQKKRQCKVCLGPCHHFTPQTSPKKGKSHSKPLVPLHQL